MERQNYTYGEIINQVEKWKIIYNDITGKDFVLHLKIFSDKYDEIIIFGCGSSYNLSKSASFFT
ncbi:unnamed protein product, partial [marine sediment metagenome]